MNYNKVLFFSLTQEIMFVILVFFHSNTHTHTHTHKIKIKFLLKAGIHYAILIIYDL